MFPPGCWQLILSPTHPSPLYFFYCFSLILFIYSLYIRITALASSAPPHPTLTLPCCPLPMGTNLPWQVRLKQDCVRPLPLRPDTAAQLGEGDPEGGIRVRVSPRSTWGPTWRPTAHLLQRWRWPGPSPCMWWFSLCEPQGYMLVNSVGLLVMSLTALAPSILP